MSATGERLLGLKRHLRAVVVPDEAVYLVSPRGVIVLRGEHMEVLLPLLDGSRTLEAVVRETAPALRADRVGALLGRLVEADVLAARVPEAGPPPDAHPASAYWDLAGLDGDRASEAVGEAPIELLAVGSADTALIRDACRGSGLRVLAADEVDDARPQACALTLVLCDDYLAAELAEVDQRQRALGRPWLLAKSGGPEPWIGPIFQPGNGPCWRCLEHRLSGHRQLAVRLRRALGSGAGAPEASIAAARTVAAQLCVLEAAKWLAGVRQPDQSTVYTLDTLTLHGRRHPVVRRPQCAGCGDPGLMAAQTRRPVRLASPPQDGPTADERRFDPAELPDRHGELIGPVTGIVRDLARGPQLPGFLFTAVSGPNLGAPSESLEGIRAVLGAHSGGKGATADEARASALGEAVERYSGARQGDEATVRGSYRSLSSEAVHPDAVQLFHPDQFASRERWNAEESGPHWVCEPFDETERREWTPVWSLTERRHRLVPTALLYYHHGRAGASAQLLADSNGCAAGPSLAEAVLRGFLELVERDAVALWWYNRTAQPAVDLDAFADPWIDGLREACARSGREVWVLDLTTDLGVPVMTALSARTQGSPRALLGFGAHFDPRVALRRALLELGQVAIALAPGDLDGDGSRAVAPRPPDPALHAWWQAMETDGLPRYTLAASAPALGPASYGYRSPSDPAADVELAVDLARRRGLELLVLDQTRPDIGIPVVRVLVPGLRPIRARFAAGRLYDVPVALGRLPRATGYAELNPIPLFV